VPSAGTLSAVSEIVTSAQLSAAALNTKLAHPTPWWVLGFPWDGLEQFRGRARGRAAGHLGFPWA
jgi:hypothetical protein